MKKKSKLLVSLSLAFVLAASLVSCGNKKTSSTTTVRLNEVTRSVFYAPMYVAMNEGFFKDEGIEIDLSTGQGADKTMQQVLSKNADIGFCGPEQVMYIYNQGREDYPVVFAQLTQRDGSFLVGRSEDKNFNWDSIRGKSIIGGRPGGVPEMAFEYVLKKNSIDVKKDIKLITNISFANTGGAFKGGLGDYVTLFEPTGSMLEKEKSGYIVSSVGAEAGSLPYTCYFATKSYIDKNKSVVESFTKAIHRGQLWVQSHSDKEVATSIKSFFPGTDIDLLTNVTKNYRDIKAFAETPSIKEEDYNRLMDIMQSYNKSLLPKRPDFKTIVNNEFADKVTKDVTK
ncbi:ABC transporter substrate-binding protein [Inconstantimicrobium mannanitabidum]|uniref:ABC transporter substrate-binding protein n=1 Tax=Inconstantimicrobium mannanitabidum TaxID=1604901 RepID=A0ACB5RC31_9CLOT|nr:ABC transporter substrate-binding protein [Clostridium sp. TW13]GKX66817.1 ABC transporter substrate-binding protein [Clostridium sp. TW13]